MGQEKENNKGMSMIEIVLVVTLIAISLGFSVLYSQTSQLRADINGQVAEFTSFVRLAHSNALSGLDGGDNGIRVESGAYTIFKGSVYDPMDPENFKVEMPEVISIENINLNGGGNDIIFSSPNGETNNYGTLTFSSNQMDKAITITITKLGTVNY